MVTCDQLVSARQTMVDERSYHITTYIYYSQQGTLAIRIDLAVACVINCWSAHTLFHLVFLLYNSYR